MNDDAAAKLKSRLSQWQDYVQQPREAEEPAPVLPVEKPAVIDVEIAPPPAAVYRRVDDEAPSVQATPREAWNVETRRAAFGEVVEESRAEASRPEPQAAPNPRHPRAAGHSPDAPSARPAQRSAPPPFRQPEAPLRGRNGRHAEQRRGSVPDFDPHMAVRPELSRAYRRQVVAVWLVAMTVMVGFFVFLIVELGR